MNIIDEIRATINQTKDWFRLEVEYYKLTAAEKLTLLVSSLVLGFVCLLMAVVVLLILAFALAEAYKLILTPALAYVSTAGTFCVLLGLLFLFRKPLLLNPIARLITRVFFDKKKNS